jgi:hypothetical protein
MTTRSFAMNDLLTPISAIYQFNSGDARLMQKFFITFGHYNGVAHEERLRPHIACFSHRLRPV